MKKRIFCILMAILLCASMFAGCNNQGNSGNLVTGTYEAPAKDTEGTLTVLCPYIERHAAYTAREKFRVIYPRVEVEIITYGEIYDDLSELEKLQARQMAGDGADVVMMDDFIFAQVCDFDKVQQSGAYIDLNQYFDNDPNWSWEGYSTSVVKGMERGGKLYLLPLLFDLTTLVTTEDKLAESGINLKKCKTGIGLMNELEKCGERLEEEGDYSKVVSSYSWLTQFENVFGTNPIQFETVEGRLEGKTVWSEDFDRMLEAYAAAGQQLGWFSDDESYGDATYYRRLYGTNHYFVVARGSDGLSDTFKGLQSLALKGKKPVVVPIYTADGKGIAAETELTASISTGCQNKDLAYEYVKMLLTEDAQEVSELSEGRYYAPTIKNQPILKEATAAAATSHFVEKVIDSNGEEVKISHQEYINQYIELADKVVYTYTSNVYSENMINYFIPYLRGEKSLEDCYEDAKSKLEIYVSE